MSSTLLGVDEISPLTVARMGNSGQLGTGMRLDETHLRMLEALREDGRTSMAALAERLNISRSNAYTRYDSLVAAGAIRGVHAVVDPAAVGLGVAAMVFVTLHQTEWADFRARLPQLEELEYFAVTTGEHDAMLLVRAPDVSAIHDLVVARLAQWPSIKATETVFLMDEDHFSVSLRPRGSDAGASESAGERYGMTRFVRTSDDRSLRVSPRGRP
ncbi:Lrp/AsnC family transcriptional regulator [Phytoactinopolyspora endophytica]|uniref:Lrp/AsnC family transcriptional regulator n=1 Tax=Phytoactinopolyspora endophytica TaxID=1642495 RepID=UPI00101B763B|nr:Lrp/AsnC family transcriptional regulator [Phytoactinopolyspora endophytica]